MRTTISISEDLYRAAKARAAEGGRTVSELIEDAVRVALLPTVSEPQPVRPLPVFGGSGLMPGVDLSDNAALGALMDEHVALDPLR